MMSNKAIIGLVLLIALVGILSAVFLTTPYQMAGSVIDPPAPAPQISLPSSHGDIYTLADHQGKLVLIFFGYTFCPDVCPTTLVDMMQVKKKLGNLSEQVEFVFITVDPKRDTQDQLTRYLNAFDPDFFGLTGNEDELSEVWKGYGVYREEQKSEGLSGYLVDHSSRLYLIDQQGNLRATYLYETPVEDIVADLKYLIKKESS